MIDEVLPMSVDHRTQPESDLHLVPLEMIATMGEIDD
jgi:hypothetical protein